MASSQLSWNYGRDRQDPWHLSRALIYHSSAATLADQVAASPTLLVMPLSGQWHRGDARPVQAASRATHVETVGKDHLPAPALRLRAANISVYLKRYQDVAAAGERAGAATARTRSCLRMGM